MGARQKLNGGYFLGSLAVACLIGCLMESALALLVSLAVMLSLNVNNGDIRLRNRRDNLTKNRGGTMAETVLIDQVHLAFYVPRGLPDTAGDEIRRSLIDPRFVRQLRRTIKDVIGQYPRLAEVRFAITR